jgi:CheY-like chemotaxis protein
VSHSASILVVGGLAETTEVLRSVFEPRGHAVNRVRQSQLPGESAPRVVVWHASESDDGAAADRFAGVPRVVIGRARITEASSAARRLTQPFEYRELLNAIEALLSDDDVQVGR